MLFNSSSAARWAWSILVERGTRCATVSWWDCLQTLIGCVGNIIIPFPFWCADRVLVTSSPVGDNTWKLFSDVLEISQGSFLPAVLGTSLGIFFQLLVQQPSKPSAVLSLPNISLLLSSACYNFFKNAFAWAELPWHLHTLLTTAEFPHSPASGQAWWLPYSCF